MAESDLRSRAKAGTLTEQSEPLANHVVSDTSPCSAARNVGGGVAARGRRYGRFTIIDGDRKF